MMSRWTYPERERKFNATVELIGAKASQLHCKIFEITAFIDNGIFNKECFKNHNKLEINTGPEYKY